MDVMELTLLCFVGLQLGINVRGCLTKVAGRCPGKKSIRNYGNKVSLVLLILRYLTTNNGGKYSALDKLGSWPFATVLLFVSVKLGRVYYTNVLKKEERGLAGREENKSKLQRTGGGVKIEKKPQRI